jgi:hypothetical protein
MGKHWAKRLGNYLLGNRDNRGPAPLRTRRIHLEPLESRHLLSAVRVLPGFEEFSLAANDDESSAAVDIGFEVDFFGEQHDSLYVNNNGNVTFGADLFEYTPESLAGVDSQIIAPFWADVDTRGIGTVSYGTDVIDGRDAFGVTWTDVGYFEEQEAPTNTFQLVLVDRSDVATGAFDIEFNYDSVLWETGDASDGENGLGGTPARAGFSNGSGDSGTVYELVGSGVSGSFLDSNPATGLVHNSLNTTLAGRHLFEVRDGSPMDQLGWIDPDAPAVILAGHDLSLLHAEYERFMSSDTGLEFVPSNNSLHLIGGSVVVDMVASGEAADLKSDLSAIGFSAHATYGRMVSGLLPIISIPLLEQMETLAFAKPSSVATNIGATNSQGDQAMGSDLPKTILGLDGSGVEVGVLSDSFDNLGGAAAGIASGDLPGTGNPNGFDRNVIVIQENPVGTGNEVQAIQLVGVPTGGSFAVRFNDGGTISPPATIPWNATAVAVRQALEGLPIIAVGDVAVAGAPCPVHRS